MRAAVASDDLECDPDLPGWEQHIADRAPALRAGRIKAVPAEEVDLMLGCSGDPPASTLDQIS